MVSSGQFALIFYMYDVLLRQNGAAPGFRRLEAVLFVLKNLHFIILKAMHTAAHVTYVNCKKKKHDL